MSQPPIPVYFCAFATREGGCAKEGLQQKQVRRQLNAAWTVAAGTAMATLLVLIGIVIWLLVDGQVVATTTCR